MRRLFVFASHARSSFFPGRTQLVRGNLRRRGHARARQLGVPERAADGESAASRQSREPHAVRPREPEKAVARAFDASQPRSLDPPLFVRAIGFVVRRQVRGENERGRFVRRTTIRAERVFVFGFRRQNGAAVPDVGGEQKVPLPHDHDARAPGLLVLDAPARRRAKRRVRVRERGDQNVLEFLSFVSSRVVTARHQRRRAYVAERSRTRLDFFRVRSVSFKVPLEAGFDFRTNEPRHGATVRAVAVQHPRREVAGRVRSAVDEEKRILVLLGDAVHAARDGSGAGDERRKNDTAFRGGGARRTTLMTRRGRRHAEILERRRRRRGALQGRGSPRRARRASERRV